MSKLKAFDVGLGQYCEDGSPCVVAFATGRTTRALNEKIYLKSEVDAVIAELEKNLSEIQSQKMQLEDDIALLRRNNAELKKQVHDYAQGLYVDEAMGEKESRHHKYKRCLAMAEMCGNAYDKWMMKKAKAIVLGQDGVKYYRQARWKVSLYMRWHKRWLELAEKFKGAK